MGTYQYIRFVCWIVEPKESPIICKITHQIHASNRVWSSGQREMPATWPCVLCSLVYHLAINTLAVVVDDTVVIIIVTVGRK